MARAFMQANPERDGHLEIEEVHPNFVEVYFVPPDTVPVQAWLETESPSQRRAKLLDINGQERYITIFPIVTLANKPDFLSPKYSQVERITIDNATSIFPDIDYSAPETAEEVIELLEELPSAFVKDYAYGLGLAQPYRFIINAVESVTDCTEVVITGEHETGEDPEGNFFYISKKDFEALRLAINRIDRLARVAAGSVKTAHAYNLLAERVGLEKIEPKVGRHPYRKLFTDFAQGKEELAEDDQNALISALSGHAGEIAEDQPEKLAKLRGDIELVTLEALVKRYAAMLGKKLPESDWQDFFNENPFILSLAFGYPVIKVRDQASVGGRKLTGGGEKITDFLVKNSLTDNTAIFEIKTPQTPILNKTPFRDGVYTPSSDLSGSINQALDQKYQFQKQVAQIKENSRIYDIETYAVHGCLVIGQTPDGEEQRKSFELFRRNSKDIDVVTFDELLENLRQLNTFLRTADEEVTS